jgi:hypothetical protein
MSIELCGVFHSSSLVSMLPGMCSRSFLFVSTTSYYSNSKEEGADEAVFQPKLDILGMVIYATEFVLWCGVFACGGYYNLTPWVRQRLSDRAQRKQTERAEIVIRMEADSGVSNDVDLSRIPSSTSVFRTPSSIASTNSSLRS